MTGAGCNFRVGKLIFMLLIRSTEYILSLPDNQLFKRNINIRRTKSFENLPEKIFSGIPSVSGLPPSYSL